MTRRICNQAPLAAVLALTTALLLALAGTADAAGVPVCVPSKEGKPIVTPKAGVCKAGYTLTELGEGKEGKEGPEGKPGKSPFTAEETATLKAILPFIKFVASGVGAKPTIVFSGANVQIRSNGANQSVGNGTGNLIVGFDEAPGNQTGSNNVVLGGKQAYEGTGAFIGGEGNTVFGTNNFAFGYGALVNGFKGAVVLGGRENSASGEYSVAVGGNTGKASGFAGTVTGGFNGTASGSYSLVGGGSGNKATESVASVIGGEFGVASALGAAVFGGSADEASAKDSAVLGGKGVKVTTEYGHTP